MVGGGGGDPGRSVVDSRWPLMPSSMATSGRGLSSCRRAGRRGMRPESSLSPAGVGGGGPSDCLGRRREGVGREK